MVYRVREIREEKKITQEELSAKSGVSRATIWALETKEGTANTTTKTLLRLAEALGVELDDLFLARRA